MLRFLTAVAHDAISLSLSSFFASRLEEWYEKMVGGEQKEEEGEEKKDGQ